MSGRKVHIKADSLYTQCGLFDGYTKALKIGMPDERGVHMCKTCVKIEVRKQRERNAVLPKERAA